MSTISSGTTLTTGYVVTSDTTGQLVIKTGSGATTALTIDASQNVSFNGNVSFSTPLTIGAGSAAAPSIAPTGDSNTGMFFPAADTIAFSEGGTEALRLTSTGAIAVNGAANYGTSGQVLTSTGNGPPTWQLPAGLPTMNIVSGTTQAAVANNHYVLTNAATTTVTLPASPSAGDVVWVTVANGLTTNVIARNSQVINGIAQDMTIDSAYAGIQLRFSGESKGWVFT